MQYLLVFEGFAHFVNSFSQESPVERGLNDSLQYNLFFCELVSHHFIRFKIFLFKIHGRSNINNSSNHYDLVARAAQHDPRAVVVHQDEVGSFCPLDLHGLLHLRALLNRSGFARPRAHRADLVHVQPELHRLPHLLALPLLLLLLRHFLSHPLYLSPGLIDLLFPLLLNANVVPLEVLVVRAHALEHRRSILLN